MIILQGMAEHRFSNVYKKKKGKFTAKLTILWCDKKPTSLQRNGMAAIPKIVLLNLNELAACSDQYWVLCISTRKQHVKQPFAGPNTQQLGLFKQTCKQTKCVLLFSHLDYCILKDLMPKDFPPGALPLVVHMEMGLYVSTQIFVTFSQFFMLNFNHFCYKCRKLYKCVVLKCMLLKIGIIVWCHACILKQPRVRHLGLLFEGENGEL